MAGKQRQILPFAISTTLKLVLILGLGAGEAYADTPGFNGKNLIIYNDTKIF